MNDFIVAIFFKDCYAGETVLKLKKVFCSGETIPKEYTESNAYIIKAMRLCEIK